MSSPGICVLCLADTCTSEVHPVFNPVAPYGYLLSDMYLFMAETQIQTCLFKVVGPGLVSTSPAFVSSSASHPAGPLGRHAQENGKSGTHCWGREGRFDTICTAASVCCDSPPLVGRIIWTGCSAPIMLPIPTILIIIFNLM